MFLTLFTSVSLGKEGRGHAVKVVLLLQVADAKINSLKYKTCMREKKHNLMQIYACNHAVTVNL